MKYSEKIQELKLDIITDIREFIKNTVIDGQPLIIDGIRNITGKGTGLIKQIGWNREPFNYAEIYTLLDQSNDFENDTWIKTSDQNTDVEVLATIVDYLDDKLIIC